MNVVIDFETGGLDPQVHSALSVGLVHVLSGNSHSFLICEDPMVVTGQALAINKLDLRQNVQDGKPPLEAVQSIEEFLRKCAVVHEGSTKQVDVLPTRVCSVGWNVEFDYNFMRRLYRLAGCGNRFQHIWHYRKIDMCSVVRFFRDCGRLPGLPGNSLVEVARYFDLPEVKNAHNALADAVMVRKLCLVMELIGK